jgi:uncharacterized membrane-anchored protein
MSASPSPHPSPVGAGTLSSAGPLRLSKVPEITLLFWIIKILTTGTGESASDWLLNRGEGLPGLGIMWALVIDFGLFVVAFVLQFAVRRYIPAVYWLAVLAVGIVGTVVADIMHFLVGVPLWGTTGVYAAILAIDFMLWHRSEGTLSVHSIFTVRREVYYWVAVFFTFALGTALGDLTAQVWNLGFFGSIFLFGALMLVPATLHVQSSVNAVFVFWFAYVLTRPLGASIADWLSVPPNEGGLGLGSGPVTWVATAVIVALVAYVSFRPPTMPAEAETGNARETDDES